MGTIQIKISRVDKIFEVEYKDSGIGISDNVDFENPTSLGLMLVRNLTEQIGGTVEYSYDNGACFKIEFKESESF
jgi:two-component sensor histidine kinase